MSLNEIKSKKRGRPIKKDSKVHAKVREYVREEWKTNPNTSRTKLCKDVKNLFGVSIKPRSITDMTAGIDKPRRPEKQYKPRKFKEGMSKGKPLKTLREEKFESVFGVKEITEANADSVIKTLKTLDSRSRANIRKDLVRYEYSQAVKDKDVKKIALYDKIFASLSNRTGWDNNGEQSAYRNLDISKGVRRKEK